MLIICLYPYMHTCPHTKVWWVAVGEEEEEEEEEEEKEKEEEQRCIK